MTVPIAMRTLPVTCACWLISAWAACAPEEHDSPVGQDWARAGGEVKANLILITIDTLRADRVSHAGYKRSTTPTLDGLARGGITFSRAYAASSWTVPSMASLFTALWPPTHGIEHGHAEWRREDVVVTEQEVLPDAQLLWAEIFHKRGYRCYGFSGNGHLTRPLGFGQGFDHLDSGWMDAPRVVFNLARQRDAILARPPYFVWVHLLDPHAPYAERHPWLAQYAPDYKQMRRTGLSTIDDTKDFEKRVARKSPELAYLNALYDAEVSHTDLYVEIVLGLLQASERDVVIITSDHGEQFLEHNHFGHGGSLFEEEVRVPLTLRLPGGDYTARTIDTPVS